MRQKNEFRSSNTDFWKYRVVDVLWEVIGFYSDFSFFEENEKTTPDIQLDLTDYIIEWCLSVTTIEACHLFLQKIKHEKEVFVGDFVKAVLKINAICKELQEVVEVHGLPPNLVFLEKIKQISFLMMKFVVTNQSLYVLV